MRCTVTGLVAKLRWWPGLRLCSSAGGQHARSWCATTLWFFLHPISAHSQWPPHGPTVGVCSCTSSRHSKEYIPLLFSVIAHIIEINSTYWITQNIMLVKMSSDLANEVTRVVYTFFFFGYAERDLDAKLGNALTMPPIKETLVERTKLAAVSVWHVSQKCINFFVVLFLFPRMKTAVLFRAPKQGIRLFTNSFSHILLRLMKS